MILTCPECDTRFVVPSTIFANGGRKLKCSTCGHKWMQQNPNTNDSPAFDKDFTADDIVRNPSKDKISADLSLSEKIKDDFANGRMVIIATACFILLIFMAYVMTRPSLIMGQGLAFDQVTVERLDDTINVFGQIVNAMNDDRGVPTIKVTQLLNENIEGDTILLSPEKEILSSGEMLNFSLSLDNIDNTVQSLSVTFQGVAEEN